MAKAPTQLAKNKHADEPVSKSISLPPALFEEVMQKRIRVDEELDFSKYVRRLIRDDLKRQQQEEKVAA